MLQREQRRVVAIYTLDLVSTDTVWEELPCAPMSDNRSTPSVVSYDEKWLIVIGGKGMNGAALDSVERVNVEDPVDKHRAQRHWRKCQNLPVKCAYPSSAIVDGHIFTFITTGKRFSNSVYCAALQSLVTTGNADVDGTVWKEIRDLPLKAATAVSYGGSLLALGGIVNSDTSSSMFKLEYNPNSDKQPTWKKIIDDLPCALYQCAAVQILEQIFIYGCHRSSNSIDVCVYVHRF